MDAMYIAIKCMDGRQGEGRRVKVCITRKPRAQDGQTLNLTDRKDPVPLGSIGMGIRRPGL